MILTAEHVSAGYHVGLPVLRDVNLDLEGPGLVAIVGRAGAGKSLLCAVLAGVHPPLAGSVRWNGTDIYDPLDLAALASRVGLLAHVDEPSGPPAPKVWPPVIVADDLLLSQTRTEALAVLTDARQHALVLLAAHVQGLALLEPGPDRLFELAAGHVEEFAP